MRLCGLQAAEKRARELATQLQALQTAKVQKNCCVQPEETVRGDGDHLNGELETMCKRMKGKELADRLTNATRGCDE